MAVAYAAPAHRNPRQVLISRHGPPEVLIDDAVEPETCGPGQVRVRVAAAGVNFADIAGRLGNYPDAPPVPYCPGYEVSGTAIEIGDGVEGIAPGDRLCSLIKFGGYAEEVVIDARAAFKLPEGVDLEIAAGIPVVYVTAHTCLFAAGGLEDGNTVLILGGAGGVGSAAIQLARRRKVTIIATAGSQAKCTWMAEHGVHHPIDYNQSDVVAEVRRITDGRGVDLVLDPIGGRGIRHSIEMCAPLGRVVLFGASSISTGKRKSLLSLLREGPPMRFFNLIPLFSANVGIHALNMLHLTERDPDYTRGLMTDVLADVASGALAPVVAERFSLSAAGARQAHHYVQDRKNIGKVLLVADLE